MIFFNIEHLRKDFDEATAKKIRNKLFARVPHLTKTVLKDYVTTQGKVISRIMTLPNFNTKKVIEVASEMIQNRKAHTKIEDWQLILDIAIKYRDMD